MRPSISTYTNRRTLIYKQYNYTILKKVERIHDILILQLKNNNNNDNNSKEFLNHVKENLVLKYLH